MKNDDHHRFRIRLFEGVFQQAPRDSWITVVHLTEQFHLVRAESGHAAAAAQQAGEGGGERRERPEMALLGLVVIDAGSGIFLLLLTMLFFQQLQVTGSSGVGDCESRGGWEWAPRSRQ